MASEPRAYSFCCGVVSGVFLHGSMEIPLFCFYFEGVNDLKWDVVYKNPLFFFCQQDVTATFKPQN